MTDDKLYNWKEDKRAYLGYGFFIGAVIATTILTVIW